MASGGKMTPDSDEEVDLEALRLAALQTLHAKPKFTPHVNHSNLIPIVPVSVVTPIVVHPVIKLEPISPTLEENIQVNSRTQTPTKDEERDSLETESDQENEEDILSMDDKEEEDSLERLMDQLEAEISGKAPIPSNRTVIAPKKPLSDLKSPRKVKKGKKRDVEVELVEVKIGKNQGPVINIRESASPELGEKLVAAKTSPARSNSPIRSPLRSRSRSRTRSPLLRSKGFRRSTSPYWSKSPHRSRSPRRSRSPFQKSRFQRSKSPFRKSRSPYRRSKSPLGRRRSPYRYSRSRSRSFDRRSRSPWSYSPRRRSRSPHFRDSYSPFHRRRNVLSPEKFRKRSISPRGKSRSPRHRSRSPRRFMSGRRNSPYHRSKSPLRRSRSPIRNKSPFRRNKSPYRHSTSPFTRRTKSPINSTDSTPHKRRSPLPSARPLRRSKSIDRRSLSPGRRQKSPKSPGGIAKSPSRRNDSLRRSLSRSKRSRSFSGSPRQRNRTPLRGIDKNKSDENEKLDNPASRGRAERRTRSTSKDKRNENYRRHERRPYRSRGFRKFSPLRDRKTSDGQKKKSRSPKKKMGEDKVLDAHKNQLEDKGTSPVPLVSVDPVLEARKKKFENLNEVDPTVDKKISLKSIKESSDNAPLDEDEDALNINLEMDLWEESEESENENESRFKTGEAKIKTNRTVLSFRNLREDDSKKIDLSKPLIDDTRREKYGNNRFDRWQRGRRNDRNDRNHRKKHEELIKSKTENSGSRERKFEPQKNKVQDKDLLVNKKSGRKVIVFTSPPKGDAESKNSEVSAISNVANNSELHTNEGVSFGFDGLNGAKDKEDKSKSDVRDTDDFDKLISDFEKELQSDICLPPKETIQTVSFDQNEMKRLKVSVKKDLFENQSLLLLKKPVPSASRLNEVSSAKERDDIRRIPDPQDLGEIKEPDDKSNQPEDYLEDDDFTLDEGFVKKRKTWVEEEDGQNDLRDILSRRRNERLTKVVSLQEAMPARLVQSAFQGLGNKKSKRLVKETQGAVELYSSDRNLKVVGTERRRVLLLQRKKPDVPSIKVTVPEVKPDTTIHQRLTRSDERKRSRKLEKHIEAVDEVDQEEQQCFQAEEKQPRRVRLKRNVTLSSQGLSMTLAAYAGGLGSKFSE